MSHSNHGWILGVVVASVVVVGTVIACSSETTGTGPGGSSGTSGSSGASCTPSTGDGTSACGDAICGASKYCSSTVFGECPNGCTATSNCASGQYCNLSNPSSDSRGNKVGTCRSCTPSASSSGSTSGSTGACGEFAGAYAFTAAAGSGSECSNAKDGFIGPSSECNFTQSTCSMTQACGDSGKIVFDIDGSNKGKSTTNVATEGTTVRVDCTYQFSGEGSGKSVSMQCQITGPSVLNCNFTGALK